MAKLNERQSSHQNQFSPKLSAAEELATLRTVVTILKSQPDKLLSVAVKAGITTPAGNLTKAYKS